MRHWTTRQEPEPLASRVAAARSTRRWAAIVYEHPSLAAFLESSALPDGLHCITGEGPPIDMLLQLRPDRPVVFSFHGNTPRNTDLKLPVFTGFKVTSGLDTSVALFSDPTLYLDPALKLGWFAGSAEQKLQQIYPAVLQKIIATAQARSAIFFGGSGGGFASLHYASHFPNSISLVWNPQTDIGKYNPPHVLEYARAAFGLENYEEAVASLPALISSRLSDRYDAGTRNMVLYLQNNSDGHVETHLKPFVECLGHEIAEIALGSRANREVASGKWLYLDNWGDGHLPPSPQFLAGLLRLVLEREGSWRSAMVTGEFGALIQQVAADTSVQVESL